MQITSRSYVFDLQGRLQGIYNTRTEANIYIFSERYLSLKIHEKMKKNPHFLFLFRSAAKAFISLGLEQHHAVTILGFNAPEWHIRDAILLCPDFWIRILVLWSNPDLIWDIWDILTLHIIAVAIYIYIFNSHCYRF